MRVEEVEVCVFVSVLNNREIYIHSVEAQNFARNIRVVVVLVGVGTLLLRPCTPDDPL